MPVSSLVLMKYENMFCLGSQVVAPDNYFYTVAISVHTSQPYSDLSVINKQRMN